jgi:hypothetical protein
MRRVWEPDVCSGPVATHEPLASELFGGPGGAGSGVSWPADIFDASVTSPEARSKLARRGPDRPSPDESTRNEKTYDP